MILKTISGWKICSDIHKKSSKKPRTNRVVCKGRLPYTLLERVPALRARTHTHTHKHTPPLHTWLVGWLAPWPLLFCFFFSCCFFPPVRSIPSPPPPVTVGSQSKPSLPSHLKFQKKKQPPGPENTRGDFISPFIYLPNENTTADNLEKTSQHVSSTVNRGTLYRSRLKTQHRGWQRSLKTADGVDFFSSALISL